MHSKNAIAERFAMVIALRVLNSETGEELEVTMRSFHSEREVDSHYKEAMNLLCLNDVQGCVYLIDTQTQTVTERTEIE